MWSSSLYNFQRFPVVLKEHDLKITFEQIITSWRVSTGIRSNVSIHIWYPYISIELPLDRHLKVFFCAYSESTNYLKQKQPNHNRTSLFVCLQLLRDLTIGYKIKYSHTNNVKQRIEGWIFSYYSARRVRNMIDLEGLTIVHLGAHVNHNDTRKNIKLRERKTLCFCSTTNMSNTWTITVKGDCKIIVASARLKLI